MLSTAGGLETFHSQIEIVYRDIKAMKPKYNNMQQCIIPVQAT